jgi:hypothetical protein
LSITAAVARDQIIVSFAGEAVGRTQTGRAASRTGSTLLFGVCKGIVGANSTAIIIYIVVVSIAGVAKGSIRAVVAATWALPTAFSCVGY